MALAGGCDRQRPGFREVTAETIAELRRIVRTRYVNQLLQLSRTKRDGLRGLYRILTSSPTAYFDLALKLCQYENLELNRPPAASYAITGDHTHVPPPAPGLVLIPPSSRITVPRPRTQNRSM